MGIPIDKPGERQRHALFVPTWLVSMSRTTFREASATSTGRRKACGSGGRCNRNTPGLKAWIKSLK